MFTVGINAAQSILLPLMVGPVTFGLFAGIYTNVMVAVGIGRGPIEILVQQGHTHGPGGGTLIYRQRDLFRVYSAGLLLAIVLFISLSVMQGWSVSFSLSALLAVAVGVGAASGLRRGLLITTSRTSQLELLDSVGRPAIFLAAAGLCWWMGLAEPLLLWLLGASFILVLAWPNLEAARVAATIPSGMESAFRPWSYVLGSNGLSILVGGTYWAPIERLFQRLKPTADNSGWSRWRSASLLVCVCCSCRFSLGLLIAAPFNK